MAKNTGAAHHRLTVENTREKIAVLSFHTRSAAFRHSPGSVKAPLSRYKTFLCSRVTSGASMNRIW